MDDSQKILKGIDADSELEALDKTSDRMPGYVPVIGPANRPDKIEQAFWSPRHFHQSVGLRLPDENARVELLSTLTHNFRLEGGLDLFEIARFTANFVRADLEALVNKAKFLAIKRLVNKRSQLDGGHNDVILDLLRHPWPVEDLTIKMIDLKKLGVDMEVGFLLYGPTGCGKSLIVKALVNEAGANFIHVEPMYGGESRQGVRDIFSIAKACSPCIIFFDCIDSWSIERGVEEDFWNLNQLLVELDDANERPDVYVIAATNKLDLVDSALLKRGRFGHLFYVPLPTAKERELILRAVARKRPVSLDVDYQSLAYRDKCLNFSGADLAALVNEAAMAVVDEILMCRRQGNRVFKPSLIGKVHFEEALKVVLPSVKEEDRRYHEAISKQFGSMV